MSTAYEMRLAQGVTLKRLRMEAQMSQAELAEAITSPGEPKIFNTAVAAIEAGRNSFPHERLPLLATALSQPLDVIEGLFPPID